MTDDRQTNTSLLEFPCVFPIKAIGRGHDLADIVAELVRRHVPDLTRQAVQVRPSKQPRGVPLGVLEAIMRIDCRSRTLLHMEQQL